jgi:hypothetical protein
VESSTMAADCAPTSTATTLAINHTGSVFASDIAESMTLGYATGDAPPIGRVTAGGMLSPFVVSAVG